MSKLSFRARAVDANKPMPVYIGDGVPPDYEFTSVSRAVLEMPTGMEKDEESEHHLQRALTAQQAYGTAEALAIPVPDMDNVGERFHRLYGNRGCFKAPKQYIHVQPALGFDAEVPDYDMDSEDEQWLSRQVKHLKMEITPLKFENMIDRLEKGSGQTVVSLNEAKALLKEDDELTIAVYDYWLNKRLKLQVSSLIPQVKTERRDGSMSNNPYVAFRRRTEKMQTRKNRKNDEVSYEKMLKLKKDLQKALIILEMLKRREKAKKEQLKLTVEIVEKRCQMQDWEGAMLAEAESKKDSMPRFFPIPTITPLNLKEWPSSNLSANEQPKVAQKKREYRKVKHHKHSHSYLPSSSSIPSVVSRRATVPSSSSVNSPTPSYLPYQSYQFFGPPPHRSPNQSLYEDDLVLSSSSQSDQENESNPDGAFAFKRRAGCYYLAPWEGSLCKRRKLSNTKESVQDPFADLLQTGNSVHAFHLASVPKKPEGSRCLGYVRQRIGRGGRIILDRRASQWDKGLHRLDMFQTNSDDTLSSDYAAYVRSNNIVHFRQSPISSQPIFTQSLHPNNINPSNGMHQSFTSQSNKSSLLKPILNCNFEKQVQMLVNLRHAEISSEPFQDDGKSLTSEKTRSSPPESTLSQSFGLPQSALKNSHTVGDQKASLVISAIRGLVAVCKKEQNGEDSTLSASSPISSVVKSGLANGRVGLSTMPAANILQLNYPLSTAQPSNCFPSSGSTPSYEAITIKSEPASTLSTTTNNVKLHNSVVTNASVSSESPNSSNDILKITNNPLKNNINNGFPSPTLPSTSEAPDNGLTSPRIFIDGSKLQHLTVQNLLLSPPQKQVTRQHYTALHSQQKLSNSIKLLHHQQNIQNSATIENLLQLQQQQQQGSSHYSLTATSSSSTTLLQQKRQQKSPSVLKGAHQVLVRAACSVEKPNRDSIESAQASDDKNKTFAMEVT